MDLDALVPGGDEAFLPVYTLELAFRWTWMPSCQAEMRPIVYLWGPVESLRALTCPTSATWPLGCAGPALTSPVRAPLPTHCWAGHCTPVNQHVSEPHSVHTAAAAPHEVFLLQAYNEEDGSKGCLWEQSCWAGHCTPAIQHVSITHSMRMVVAAP